MSAFTATVTAIARIEAVHTRNITGVGIGESKPAARTAAEMDLREKLNALRQEFGPQVALHFVSTPEIQEAENA